MSSIEPEAFPTAYQKRLAALLLFLLFSGAASLLLGIIGAFIALIFKAAPVANGIAMLLGGAAVAVVMVGIAIVMFSAEVSDGNTI
ncbi:MAG: hypothetical protein F6K42_21220 [Leptolyngbya sp. SIO1D8]|nr:hypothetical protein [Leptolyngbya sp. SIO1D8]